MLFRSGKALLRGPGTMAFWLILIGFHGTFFLMHLTGLMGMARRISTYRDHPEWIWLNLSSSFFSFIMAAGFALFALDLILQWLFGATSRRNPWGAKTLEWAMLMPAPSYNIASLPLPGQNALEIARGEGALPGAPRNRREALVVDALSGEAVHVAVLPSNSALPILSAGVIGGFVLLMLGSFYVAAGFWLFAVAAVFWQWQRRLGSARPEGLITAAPGLYLPVHYEVPDSLARSGLVCLLIANGALFGCFLFSLGFLSVIAPNWPAPESRLPAVPGLILSLGLSLCLLSGSLLARMREARGATPALGLQVIALGAVIGLGLILEDPAAHARNALRAAALGYIALHCVIAALFAGLCFAQRRDGRIATDRPGAGPIWRIWQDYTTATALLLIATVALQEALS